MDLIVILETPKDTVAFLLSTFKTSSREQNLLRVGCCAFENDEEAANNS